jgi:hypothetical protein
LGLKIMMCDVFYRGGGFTLGFNGGVQGLGQNALTREPC